MRLRNLPKISRWFLVKALKHILNQDFSALVHSGLMVLGAIRSLAASTPPTLGHQELYPPPTLLQPQKSRDIAKWPLEGRIISQPHKKHCSKLTLELISITAPPPPATPPPPLDLTQMPLLPPAPTEMPCSNHPPGERALSQANFKLPSLPPSAPGLPHSKTPHLPPDPHPRRS